jgi:hypothetical protein
MVNSEGQLYTIEGVAAGILMITTAYLILSTTSIFTVGDTHISDMQLEQLGNDAIAMMDFPQTSHGATDLETYIAKNDPLSKDVFNSTLLGYLNSRYSLDVGGTNNDTLKYSASVYYNNVTGRIQNYPFRSSGSVTTGREHMVRATRYVHLNEAPSSAGFPTDMVDREQMILLEVLIWRD